MCFGVGCTCATPWPDHSDRPVSLLRYYSIPSQDGKLQSETAKRREPFDKSALRTHDRRSYASPRAPELELAAPGAASSADFLWESMAERVHAMHTERTAARQSDVRYGACSFFQSVVTENSFLKV